MERTYLGWSYLTPSGATRSRHQPRINDGVKMVKIESAPSNWSNSLFILHPRNTRSPRRNKIYIFIQSTLWVREDVVSIYNCSDNRFSDSNCLLRGSAAVLQLISRKREPTIARSDEGSYRSNVHRFSRESSSKLFLQKFCSHAFVHPFNPHRTSENSSQV